ncbi:dimethyl sulfoxide reductase anchor subunit [Salipaludibacillus sp. CUR1]|uniref:dimethyl sulfoxide reductase anchor subunit family protein n=1 Tax=Salipaludibacillus sp. CUR1 TaxID=2820003 RepID=UPI001E3619EF|nr:DmsC/YnfH family molybdoenzyme membrane anchor subunit [Salipaludibacillus sp. CUR1]MCE7791795.1 dimethyl sulfoxide reductase anchor subunit [Salipaludibacillus sp. CUR1]
MFGEEWQLLLFTLLMQLAVGTYLFLTIVRASGKIPETIKMKVTKLGMASVGPVVVIAILLSVLHLGNPFGAYWSIANFASSWLSREILFTGAFFILWGVSYYLERKGSWNQLLGWAASLVGLVAIFSMASIYATSIIPAWSDFNTYLQFFGTTLFFGSIAAVLLILWSREEKTEELNKMLKKLVIVGIAAIALQLVYLPVYIAGLSMSGVAGAESVALLSSTYVWPGILRWTLTIAGAVLVVWALFKGRNQIVGNYSLLYAAVVFIIAGEILGRFIFYATGVPIMIG